jgi:hypothetical protein
VVSDVTVFEIDSYERPMSFTFWVMDGDEDSVYLLEWDSCLPPSDARKPFVTEIVMEVCVSAPDAAGIVVDSSGVFVNDNLEVREHSNYVIDLVRS